MSIVALDNFDLKGLAYMRELFPDVIEPGHALHSTWQDHAIGLLVAKSPVTSDLIKGAKKLKYVVRHGTGYDNIDAEACKAAGVTLCYCPGISSMSVAEVVLSMTGACAKNLLQVSTQLRNGEKLSKKSKSLYSASLLTGKTFGIIGGGTIGQLVAKKFVGAFDGQIVVYDPYLSADAWKDIPHRHAASVAEVLPVVDVLSLHVPLTPATKNLISLDELKQMKSTAILVNSSRGGVVNESDLWQALREGIIASAGVDVWQNEPPTRAVYGEIFDLDNLVMTPHIGGSPAEIQTQTCIAMCDRMKECIEGKEPKHRVV